MQQISVVIIARNEAENIVACIASAKKISQDIIVIDSGSTDDTCILAQHSGARTRLISWTNYATAKNTGAAMAMHNWIFSLDADERITDELAVSVKAVHDFSPEKVYGFKRLNFVGSKRISYGPLAHDRIFRLYNRAQATWNNVGVHEKLTGDQLSHCMLNGKVAHYGNKNIATYLEKKMAYASLWALKQQHAGKRAGHFFRISSTVMSFVKAYFLQLGLFDFQLGFTIARINATYTWHKYGLLQQLLAQQKITNAGKPMRQHPLSKRQHSNVQEASEA